MKKTLIIFCLSIFFTASAASGNITGEANYIGKITSVGIGFFSNVGVSLPPGETCHGQPVIVLLTSHPQFDQMYSLLLTAQASKSDVNIYRLGAESSSFGVGYCVINYISLGDFPLW